MSKVIVKGMFNNSDDNQVVVDVYLPNPDGLGFKKEYSGDFMKTFDSLLPGNTYFAHFIGHTSGTFDMIITGDIENEITQSKSGFFVYGSKFKTL